MMYKTRTTRPGTLGKLAGALALLLALGLLVMSAVPAMAAMEPGHKFYGVVTIDGAPAPDGTIVTAVIAGVTLVTQAVEEVTAPGQYGWADGFLIPQDEPAPGVQGGSQGDEILFYVDDVLAGSYIFFNEDPEKQLGYENFTELDLAVTTQGPVTWELYVESSGCCEIDVAFDGAWEETIAACQSNQYTLDEGTVVTLTASGDACQFDGWVVDQGDPVTDNPLTVTMDADHSAVAHCSQVFHVLTVTSTGCCDISVEDGEGLLGTVAAGTYDTFDILEGTVVTLTAVDGETCIFDCWVVDEGDPTTDNPIYVTMDADHYAEATCTPYEPPVTYELTVESAGCCDITVAWDTSTDTVYAGTSDVFTFDAGTQVTLEAECDPLYCSFLGWTVDDQACAGNPIVVDMDAGHTAVAACQTVEIGVLDIPLVLGWNTFSTPISLDPGMDTWGEFIEENDLSIDVAFYYDAAGKQWLLCTPLTPLQPLEGFYVHTTAPGIAEIVPNPGQTANPVKHLSVGLNCIGASSASLGPVNVAEFLYSVYETSTGLNGYTNVFNPAINPSWSNNAYLRNGVNPPNMLPGKAYWVVMLNPGDLYGFTSTPLEP